MGFGHRVYRAEDPRARVLRRTAHELESPRVEVAEALEQAALEELQARHPERVLATNVEFWSAVVLDIAEIPPPLFPGDVRLRAGGRLVGAHPRAEAHRAADPALGEVRRARAALDPGRQPVDARRGRRPRRRDDGRARARRPPPRGRRRAREPRRGARTTASARSPTARSASSASTRRPSSCAAGSRTRARPCRGSALLSLELLSRDHPASVNAAAPAARARERRPEPGGAPPRVLWLKNGSPTRTRSRSSRTSAEVGRGEARRGGRGRAPGAEEESRRRARGLAAAAGPAAEAAAGGAAAGLAELDQLIRAASHTIAKPRPPCDAQDSQHLRGRGIMPVVSVDGARVGARGSTCRAGAVRNMRVELGRAEVGVAEHLLDAARGRRRLRAGAWRRSGGGGGDGRAADRGPPSRPAGAG